MTTGRSLIFRYKNQIHAKFNDFVNFFAQTSQFSSGSDCQIAKAETRKFSHPLYMSLQFGIPPYMGVVEFCFCIKK